jgi:hypothetical protein
MTHDLTYPSVTTYWVAFSDEFICYGVCQPDQQTTTGLANFESYTERELWTNRLLELGVSIEESE